MTTIQTSGRQPFRLTPAQYDLLIRGLDEGRVGKNPKGYSHLEAWDVRRWLIRIFGFGGYEVENQVELVKEIEYPPGAIKYRNGGANEKPVWTVVYRCQTRLTVFDQFGGSAVFEDGACGDSSNQPAVGDAHDNAMKTALSQALKRCAVNLGDQFGLGLYNNGKTNAVVNRSLVAPDFTATKPGPTPALPVDEPVLPEPGTAPAAEPAEEHAAPDPAEHHRAVPPKPEPTDQERAIAMRDWALKPGRTADELRGALTRLRSDRPAVADAVVVAETGDEEKVADFMERRIREATPGGQAQQVRLETRKKRMFALFNELSYGGADNRQQRITIYRHVLQREVNSTNDLELADVEKVIAALEERQRGVQPQAVAA